MIPNENFADTIIVGGGLLGSAVAWGLTRLGQKVIVLDEGDVALRASRGNFGLVWVSGKGEFLPPYARWSRLSSELWPQLAEELIEQTGISPVYQKPGGVMFSLTEEDLARKREQIGRMKDYNGPKGYGARMMDKAELDEMLPGLGPDVLGGTYSPHDGHCNPLFLLRGLHAGLQKAGGCYVSDAPATKIEKEGSSFVVSTSHGRYAGAKLILAAGHGNRWLAPQVGLEVPLIAEKGEILVTERARPLLTMPTHLLRQTGEGTIMIGDSHEHTGYSTRSRSTVIADLARYAVHCFPALAQLRLVRSWGAVRILTPDGCPVYQQSELCPGAFSINCHSGVTLAGAHALALAPAIAEGALSGELDAFHPRRFANGTVKSAAH